MPPKKREFAKCDTPPQFDFVAHILIILLMEEIPNNHLGCIPNFDKIMGYLPTSTGDRRISEPPKGMAGI